MDNNNVNENLENVETLSLDETVSTDNVSAETEVLEPFVDTTNIVPVAPPVALVPPVEVTTEPATEVSTEAATEAVAVENANAIANVNAANTVVPSTSVPIEGIVPSTDVVADANNDPGAFVVEVPMKEVEIGEAQSTSNFKYILTIILFIVLGGSIIFMPEISAFIKEKQLEKEYDLAPKITTGDLKCTLDRNSEKFDLEYTYRFTFKDNKLLKLYYTSITRGDANLDEQELSGLHSECLLLKDYTRGLDGLTVGCDFESGTFTKDQSFDFSVIEVDSAYTAYSEAGGVYPEYNYLEDMDKIEKNMKAAGYTCERFE